MDAKTELAIALGETIYANTIAEEREACARLEAENERLRNVVAELAKLAQHADNCSWVTPLLTGEGYWGCDCGLDNLVLDGEPTDAALTPTIETAKNCRKA